MKLLLLSFLCALAACAAPGKINSEPQIILADLLWVKLHPAPLIQSSRKLENGLEEIVVSNSCGRAEAAYRRVDGHEFRTWMRMGEWCENPFDAYPRRHLLVITQGGELEEFFGLELDSDGREFVLVTSGSVLGDLRSQLAQPVHTHDLDHPDEAQYYEDEVENGDVEIRGTSVFRMTGVFVDDVIAKLAP